MWARRHLHARRERPEETMPRQRRTRTPEPEPLMETVFAGVTARLLLAESTFGTPRPRIQLDLPAGTSFRVTTAKAYMLAAAVELATLEPRAAWVVCVNPHEIVAWVDLELSEGLPCEVQAGLDALRAVLSKGML